jgi:hypothetical protein
MTRVISQKTFTAGWRTTWKGDDQERVSKSRLYVKGFEDKRDPGWLETYSGIMDHGLMQVGLIYRLHRGWEAAIVDVKTAFLKADASHIDLHIRTPADVPEEAKELGYEANGVYPMLKAVCGRSDSARLYTQEYIFRENQGRWVD